MKRAALVTIVALAAMSAPCGAQELGRLFFSPAEREALDAQRRDKANRPPAVAAPAPMRIDGYVLRSGDRATVWVNGGAVAGSLLAGMHVKPSTAHPGEVAVTPGASGSGVKVKVGSTLDHASGETRDVIENGRVQVRR